MAKKAQAVLYARVSSKEQEREGFSIPAQCKLLRSYAVRNEFKIVGEFIDVETAKQSGRTNFTKMIERPGPGQFRLKPPFDARLNLFHTPMFQVGFTTINMKDPLLGKNRALRQAIARLFDTQAEIDVLANGNTFNVSPGVIMDGVSQESRYRQRMIPSVRFMAKPSG